MLDYRSNVAVALLMATLASPALAGDGACLFRSLPQHVQASVLDAYGAGDSKVATRVLASNPPTPEAQQACGFNDERRAGWAVGAYAMEIGSLPFLAREGYAQADLDRGWASIKPADMDVLTFVVGRAILADEGIGPASEIVANAAKEAGWTNTKSPREFLALVSYYVGRAAREGTEAGF